MTTLDGYQLAARNMREHLRDKSYRAYPMGQEAGAYLRWKRGRITESTYRDYEACLDKLARFYPDFEIAAFEPRAGTELLEEFLDTQWGNAAPRTYNKNLSVVKDLFKFAVLKGKLHGDPTLPMLPHKKRDVHREIFSQDDRVRVYANGPDSDNLRRDRIALRLLLDYGIRKGSLQKIQFKHFDHNRRKLTIFAKGAKVREIPLVDPAVWDDLEKLEFELGSESHHYLMSRRKTQMSFRGYDRVTGAAKTERRQLTFPDQPMGSHGLHDWWYGCLQRAGVVAKGVTNGERMHKARHSAGQRVLDKTGNVKAVQQLLGHADPSTTMGQYLGWDEDRLESTMREVLGDG